VAELAHYVVANSTGSLRKQEPTMIVVEDIDERRQTVKGWDG
jgi:hypothetical protein